MRSPSAWLVFVLVVHSAAGLARGQYMGEEYAPAAGLSKTMQMAVRFYDEGKDSDAMDRFMEVLSNGDPAERTMANEYLNLITQRMYSGSSITPKTNTNPSPATIVEGLRTPARPVPPKTRRPEFEAEPESVPAPAAPASRNEAEPARADRSVMKKEIEGKLKNQARVYLAELERMADIRVLMADRHNPRAIGIPSGMLFDAGIVFKRDAEGVLRSLAGLVFSLGATQAAILPEGAVLGDAKILDMRRTMGVSAHLYAAGVAPPRVRVNLLSSQLDVPKGISDFRGIIILFIYNQPLALTADGAIGEESGPPVSLGVWPEKFRGDRGEGSIIEFSVVEPPAGLMSWKFQLRRPGGSPGADLEPLQEVIGGAPVFHQIYWNGKKNYFGADLAPGRYEAVMTATDSKNRSRTLHRWITLEGVAPPLVAMAPKAAPPPAELKKAPVYVQVGKAPAKVSKGKPAPKKKLRAKKRRKPQAAVLKRKKEDLGSAPARDKRAGTAEVEKAAGDKPAAPSGDKPAADKGGADVQAPGAKPKPSSAVNYKVGFAKGAQQMSADGDRTLGLVADAMTYYPRENLTLVGYASSGEPDAGSLARKRAEIVSGLLVQKYNVDSKRIQIQSKVVDGEASEVEIFTVSAK